MKIIFWGCPGVNKVRLWVRLRGKWIRLQPITTADEHNASNQERATSLDFFPPQTVPNRRIQLLSEPSVRGIHFTPARSARNDRDAKRSHDRTRILSEYRSSPLPATTAVSASDEGGDGG